MVFSCSARLEGHNLPKGKIEREEGEGERGGRVRGRKRERREKEREGEREGGIYI